MPSETALTQHFKALERDIVQNMCGFQRKLTALANASITMTPALPICGIHNRFSYDTPEAQLMLEGMAIKSQLMQEANALAQLRKNGPTFAQMEATLA